MLSVLDICVMFCCALSEPGVVSDGCTWHMFGYVCVLRFLERTWCCQCLLHLAYVLAICGAWSAPMCWLYVLWGAWHIPGARGEWPL